MFTEKGKTLKPSRRFQAKGEVSTLQTGKDTNICERFIDGLNLIIKKLSPLFSIPYCNNNVVVCNRAG